MINLTNEQLEKCLKQYLKPYLEMEELLVNNSISERKYNNDMKLLSAQYDIADNFLNILGINYEFDENQLNILFKHNNEIVYKYNFEQDCLIKEISLEESLDLNGR